jgi:oxygen-independent coproporphyrinogen-3 oxidase
MSESLYIHIPFCLKKCIYCDFISGIYDAEQAVIYIEALKKEISHIPGKTPLSTLFIGGGTPTALRQDTLSNLLEHTFKLFNFNGGYIHLKRRNRLFTWHGMGGLKISALT